MLIAALAALAALAAGATGTWSPCGFSMIDTLASPHSGRGRPLVLASGLTFLAGALGGGVVTFASLAFLGGRLADLGGRASLAAATAVGLAAAAGELAGVRIVPQIRRQVPESWRRVLPLPVAGGLYGLLLGLGFTTFVLTLGVWALAVICTLVGSVGLGIVVGLAFGAGRALPVVVLAASIEGRREHLLTAMSERPSLLRAARVWDGLALGGLALALLLGAFAGAAGAAPLALVPDGRDPTASGVDLAFSTSTGEIVTLGGAGETGRVVAEAVALGGGNRAVVAGHVLRVWPAAADWASAEPALSVPVAGVSGLAVSGSWVAWRGGREDGGDLIQAVPLASVEPPRVVAASAVGNQLSRPSLAGDVLAYAVNSRRLSRIVSIDLASGRRAILRSTRFHQLRDPALRGSSLLHVEETYCAQRLVVGRAVPRARDRALLVIGSLARRDAGYERGRTTLGSEAGRCPGAPPRSAAAMGTTALSASVAYVSLWRPVGSGPTLSRIRGIPLIRAAAG